MTGILGWASELGMSIEREVLHVWDTIKPLTKCQGLTIFGVTFIMIVGASVLRAWYHFTRRTVHIAEIGIDLATGALALALTVPLEALCRYWFGDKASPFIPFTHQANFWVIVVPLISLAAIQANSWLLSDVARQTPQKRAYAESLSAAGAMSLGLAVLALAAGFHASRLGCPT